MIVIKIAEDFSRTPAGRYKTDGPESGENFRERFLKEPISESKIVKIVLDGAAGYPSSFLEEAFGGLVRKRYSDAEKLRQILIIENQDTEYDRYKSAIWRYINNAKPERQIMDR